MRKIPTKSKELNSGMKKFFLCLVLILSFSFSSNTVLSIEITSCSSDGQDFCEIGRVCTCSISGECTNGNLLLYRDELTNPVCSPQIVANSVSIDPDYCELTEGLLYAIADCDEGQSPQKGIMFSRVETTTTTSTTTTPITTTSIITVTVQELTHECFGGKGYCEDLMAECQSGYVYCPEYNDDCPAYDEKCCCMKEEYEKIFPGRPEVNLKLVAFIVLAAVIGVVIFLFFVTQTKKGMSFEKLYKKWSR